MEQQLLAMLKSASSQPAPLPSTGNGPVSPQEATSPPPLLPQAFSPSPSQQPQVSIQDLFRGLQAPTSAPPVAASQPVQQGQDHQARLLNMLKGLGGQAAALPKPAESPSPGPGTPGHTILTNGGPQEPVSDLNKHAKGLLDMFNKTPATASTHAGEPVIDHPSQSPAPSKDPASSAHSTPARPADPLPQPTQPSAPATPAASTPKKSIFDFVSPFDAFDKPPPAATSARVIAKLPAAAAPAEAAPVPAPKQKVQSPAPVGTPTLPSAPTGQLNKVKERADSPASAADSSKLEGRAEGGTAKKKKGELDLPYKVGTVVGNASGKGARSLSSHTVIDISQPNLDGLCNDKDAVRPIPTTIMKSENIGFSPGKAVASTATWMGYAMTRGRIRLIDRTYGARLLLQLPPSGSTGPQLDLTHTSTRLASLACDGSIVVWAVPKSWGHDNTPCPVIASIAPGTLSQGIGMPFSIQWVNREGTEGLLAIGGKGGVVLIDPSQVGGTIESPVPFAQAIRGKKVLKAEGTMAAFCLNRAHGALGVISTDSHLTLYSVVSQTPVWGRALPTEASSSPPTSVAFCETQILVGRENNTLLELVQITTEVAVLSSIRFTTPAPFPLHFTQPVYDHERTVLWVTNFARGSLYGFHFALRGKAPVTGLSGSNPARVIAFDRMVELPLEPTLSFVVCEGRPDIPIDESLLHLYYSTPSGVGDAYVETQVLAGLLDGEGVEPFVESVKPRVSTPPVPGQVKQATPKAANKKQPPKAAAVEKEKEKKVEPVNEVAEKKVVIKTETIAVEAPPAPAAPITESTVPASAPAPSSGGESVGVDGFVKALKKTEDGLSNKLKQLVTKEIAGLSARIESSQLAESTAAVERQNALVAKITSEIERSLKGTVAAAVKDEIKSSILPILETVTRHEVKDAVAKSSTAQISQYMQTLPREIEKILAPTLTRTFSQTLQPIVERSVHDMVSKTLIPSYTQTTTQMYDQLSRDIRSEMLDIRKEIVSEQGEALTSTKSLVLTMANSLAALSSQVQSLSEQLAHARSSSQPQSIPQTPHYTVPVPPTNFHAAPPIAPPVQPFVQEPPKLRAEEVEEIFLAALSSPEQPRSIMELIRGQWSATDLLLPRGGAKSPLSQAVLLSLLHRLGTVLAEAPPLEDGFNMALAWAHRVARLIDPKDADTSTYVGRVLPTVQALLRTATLNLSGRAGEQGARALGAIHQINVMLAEKLATI